LGGGGGGEQWERGQASSGFALSDVIYSLALTTLPPPAYLLPPSSLPPPLLFYLFIYSLSSIHLLCSDSTTHRRRRRRRRRHRRLPPVSSHFTHPFPFLSYCYCYCYCPLLLLPCPSSAFPVPPTHHFCCFLCSLPLRAPLRIYPFVFRPSVSVCVCVSPRPLYLFSPLSDSYDTRTQLLSTLPARHPFSLTLSLSLFVSFPPSFLKYHYSRRYFTYLIP